MISGKSIQEVTSSDEQRLLNAIRLPCKIELNSVISFQEGSSLLYIVEYLKSLSRAYDCRNTPQPINMCAQCGKEFMKQLDTELKQTES